MNLPGPIRIQAAGAVVMAGSGPGLTGFRPWPRVRRRFGVGEPGGLATVADASGEPSPSRVFPPGESAPELAGLVASLARSAAHAGRFARRLWFSQVRSLGDYKDQDHRGHINGNQPG